MMKTFHTATFAVEGYMTVLYAAQIWLLGRLKYSDRFQPAVCKQADSMSGLLSL